MEDLPRVTPAMLRRADDLCRRRLAREYEGGKPRANRVADARFAVANRLVADARLAHAEADGVRAEAFVEPRELEPEQQALYRAGVRGYLSEFGHRPGRSTDLGWRTTIEQHGVELICDPGLALERPDGGREVRILKLGGRRTGAPLLDSVELRCVLLRTEVFAPEQLIVVASDLIEQESVTHVPDLAVERAEAAQWVAERIAVIMRHARDARPRAGNDCNGCAFVAGCAAHA
ncbi:MAG: hypothetical protein ACRDV7_02990 [Acidimicrobiia bacterium]